MEDEENWLLLVQFLLILDVLLVLLEKFGVELDVAGLVDTVNIAEASSNREVWRNLLQGSVDSVDVFGLSVQGVVVNVFVVDTILLTTSDTDLLSYSQPVFVSQHTPDLPSPATASWVRPA